MVMPQVNWREDVPVLRGAHVDLREIRLTDALTLTEHLSDPAVCRYISTPPSTPGAFQGFVKWAQQQRAGGTMVCFAVVPHGLEHAVGIFQVRALAPDFSTAEWGFAIAAPFWGTGVFDDAAPLVAEFAFGTLRVNRLEARAVTSNDRGNGALAKLGARGEAILRGGLVCDGGRRDQFLWTIVADEWMTHRAARYSETAATERIRAAVAASQTRMFGAPLPPRRSDAWNRAFLLAGAAAPPDPDAIDFDADPDR
jgi:RimJ/RimL family protein N-acetyltransferase